MGFPWLCPRARERAFGVHYEELRMCNLYSLTRAPEELRRAFRIMHDRTGNLPPLPDIFPDQLAPVVRTRRDGERELTMMRWGFPPPPALGTRPVTNVRNVKSPYWRGWLRPDFRCLVPATSFCEYTDSQPKVPHWFALGGARLPPALLSCRACLCDDLAKLHRAAELTPVWVPDQAHEAIRDLVRARLAAVRTLRQARQQLSGFLLRHGHHYNRPPGR